MPCGSGTQTIGTGPAGSAATSALIPCLSAYYTNGKFTVPTALTLIQSDTLTLDTEGQFIFTGLAAGTYIPIFSCYALGGAAAYTITFAMKNNAMAESSMTRDHYIALGKKECISIVGRIITVVAGATVDMYASQGANDCYLYNGVFTLMRIS